jgi:hypothetical protein
VNNYGQYNISSYLAPAQPLQVTTGVGWEYIRIVNNSPYLLNINFNGMGNIVSPEFFLEDVYLPSSYRGSITITPVVNITTVGHATSKLVTINAYSHGEIASPQAQPLAQPAVNETASGKPLFTASIGFPNTAQTSQGLNIFNPANSGVTFTFHAARVFTNDTSVPGATMLVLNGADLNYSTPVAAVSHAGTAVPPVSFAHCTGQELPGGGGTLIEAITVPVAPVTQDFLVFPDNVSLTPGNNLRIVITTGAAGKSVRLTMKWSEDIAIPPQGGVITGVATSIINQGNPSQNIITAAPSGDAGTAVQLTNDAKLALGDTTNSGVITLAGLLSKINFLAGSISRITISGPFIVAIAGTSCAHGLGVVPDFVIAVNDAGASQVNNYALNFGTMTTTNVTVYSTLAGARTWLLSIKI